MLILALTAEPSRACLLVVDYSLFSPGFSLPPVPLWLTLPAVGMYSLLGVWLLQNIPETFTLGELVIVSQGITILTLDTGLQLVALVRGRVRGGVGKNIILLSCGSASCEGWG